MTRPCDSFDLAQEICFGGRIITAILIAKLLHLDLVGWTQVLSDDLLRYIPADVLSIITWLFNSRFFLLRLEDLRILDFLCLNGGVVGENERSLAVAWSSDELSENGVVRFFHGKPVRDNDQVLMRIFKVKIVFWHFIIIQTLFTNFFQF